MKDRWYTPFVVVVLLGCACIGAAICAGVLMLIR